jgi:hypothetical protein
LFLRILQLLAQLCLRAFVLREFGFQFTPALGTLGSFHLPVQSFLSLLVFRQGGLELTPALRNWATTAMLEAESKNWRR